MVERLDADALMMDSYCNTETVEPRGLSSLGDALESDPAVAGL